MGAKDTAAKAGVAAAAVKNSPYVKRIVQDDELRQNLVSSYESARQAVNRLQNGKNPAKQVFDDKKLQKEIIAAAASLRDVSVALRQAPEKKKKRGFGKLFVLALAGAVAALAISEDLRQKLLDALFGAEEEFEYTSTTSPPDPSTPPSTSETADSTT